MKDNHMIKFGTKILLVIFFLQIDFLIGFSYGQSTSNYKDFIIRYERINFKFNDSIYKVTLFIEPNGYFHFSDGFVESSHPGLYGYRRVNDKVKTLDYKDTFVLKSDRINLIDNLFPPLYKSDSSILNHYFFDYKPINYSYNLEYSYILNKLNEKELYGLNNKKIIRIIEPEETSGISRDYSVMILDLKQKIFHYKKGKYDLNGDYKITIDDSIKISDKQMRKVSNLVDQVDFKSVKYFTEIGLNVQPQFLLEYCDSTDYYVFEKQIFSRNKNDRKFIEILSMFWSIKANMKK